MTDRDAPVFAADELTFNSDGLIPAIVQDVDSGAVAMLAWMDAEAIRRTLDTGLATFWSRSRSEYWVKGETSGNSQSLVDMRTDCDADALLVRVRQHGPACHTGLSSCFDTATVQAVS